jgi:hypothetical protein
MGFRIRIKSRRTGIGAGRRKSKKFEPFTRDELVPFIVTPEPRVFTNDAGNESKVSESTFELHLPLVVASEIREFANDAGNESKVSESSFELPIPLVVASEPREFANDAGSDSKASECARDTNVIGWQCIWSCLGLNSPRQVKDWLDDLTSVFSRESEGRGEKLQPCSFGSSCSSFDDDDNDNDEWLGESSLTAVSWVDQVLILSPMTDDISNISSSSSDDCEDVFNDNDDYDNGDGKNDDYDNESNGDDSKDDSKDDGTDNNE